MPSLIMIETVSPRIAASAVTIAEIHMARCWFRMMVAVLT